MHNTWLIIRREYLERVRSKAFLIFTVLVPVLMFGVIILPSKLMMMKSSGTHHVVVVSADHELAQRVASELTASKKDEKPSLNSDDQASAPKYTATVETDTSDSMRQQLNQRIDAGSLDGYLLLAPDAATTRKVTYYTKNSSDFIETETMRGAVRVALTRSALANSGIKEDEVQALLKSVSIDTLRVEKGKVTKSGGILAFLLPMMLMMMIYMTLIIYGVAVMRSVIEEKTSRVMEVLLSSVTAKELMAGKILGVGAVGLTQVMIWAGTGFVLGTGAIAAARDMMKDVTLPPAIIIAFPVFFLLGFLLYSSMYAALGAMVNSDEEAQQMQWPVVMPLVACAVFASAIIRQPDSPMAFWLSMFPLTSPIIMFVRICNHVPPAWQLAASVGILIATTYGMVWLCSRIYRVGILMYGKRPTLPEILKWIRYA